MQAKILSQRTFTIFVVMALVTTFATTPLTIALFPPGYQKKLAAWKRGEIDWDGNRLSREGSASDGDGGLAMDKEQSSEIRRLMVCLRLESLPSLFTFVALLGGDKSSAPAKIHPTRKRETTAAQPDPTTTIAKRPLEVHGLRMLELTERLSSVMKETEADEWSTKDPVVNAFHTFGQLNNVAVSGEVQLVPEGAYPAVLSERATDRRSDMILLPWSENGTLSEAIMTNMGDSAPHTFSNSVYNQFVSKFLDTAPCNAAVFVNNGFGALPREEIRSLTRTLSSLSMRSTALAATAPLMNRGHHIFFPFVGGADDRVALRFVLRLAKNPNVTATIMHLRTSSSTKGTVEEVQTNASPSKANATVTALKAHEYTDEQDRSFFTLMSDSLASELQDRVVFDSMNSTQPTSEALAAAKAEVIHSPKNAGDLIIVGRSHGRRINLSASSPKMDEQEIRQSLGIMAETMIAGSVKASILVIHAAGKDV